jgi:hypothetical protein
MIAKQLLSPQDTLGWPSGEKRRRKPGLRRASGLANAVSSLPTAASESKQPGKRVAGYFGQRPGGASVLASRKQRKIAATAREDARPTKVAHYRQKPRRSHRQFQPTDFKQKVRPEIGNRRLTLGCQSIHRQWFSLLCALRRLCDPTPNSRNSQHNLGACLKNPVRCPAFSRNDSVELGSALACADRRPRRSV